VSGKWSSFGAPNRRGSSDLAALSVDAQQQRALQRELHDLMRRFVELES
jgi:hypothetical protein